MAFCLSISFCERELSNSFGTVSTQALALTLFSLFPLGVVGAVPNPLPLAPMLELKEFEAERLLVSKGDAAEVEAEEMCLFRGEDFDLGQEEE